MASSALDIIKGALKLINVLAQGETPSSEEASDGLKALNGIVASWNNQRLMLYAVKNVTGTLNAGQNPHTVGDGGDIDIDRPLRIEKAFVRIAGQINPIDYILEQDDNNRYQEYAVKYTEVSYPTRFYFEPSYPLAKFYTYPKCGQNLELHLSVWMQITEFTSLVAETELPPDYENALKYQLAIDLAPQFGKAASVTKGTVIYERCAQFLREIKAVNQPKWVATIDNAVLGKRVGNGAFNIYRGY